MHQARRWTTILTVTVLLGACSKAAPAPAPAAKTPATAPAKVDPPPAPAKVETPPPANPSADQRAMLLDELDSFESKSNALMMAAALVNDEEYTGVVQEMQAKIAEARAKANELDAAPPEAAGPIQQELADLIAELREVNKKLTGWASNRQKRGG